MNDFRFVQIAFKNQGKRICHFLPLFVVLFLFTFSGRFSLHVPVPARLPKGTYLGAYPLSLTAEMEPINDRFANLDPRPEVTPE